MVMAAIARAAAKAGKAASGKKAVSGAKKAANASAVQEKVSGVDSYNARRRYYRAAERELKKAESTTGAASSRFRQIARQYFNEALSTYDPKVTQAFSKPIQRLATTFGVDLGEYRKMAASRSAEETASMRAKAISRSFGSLESSMNDVDIRRENEARMLLSDDRIGSRIMGGFVDVWKEEATFYDEASGTLKVDNRKIMSKMMDYFEVDNYADLLDKIEDITGERLYSNPENDNDYESVKILIQTHIAEREYAA